MPIFEAAVEALPPLFLRISLPPSPRCARRSGRGQVFDVGGDGPLVVVGVGDAGEVVAVELVGGLGDGGGAGWPWRRRRRRRSRRRRGG